MASAHEHAVEAIEEAKAEHTIEATPVEEAPAAIESLYSPEVQQAEEPVLSYAGESAPAGEEAPIAAPSSTAPSTVQPEMNEDVAKVLAKMNPDVLQAVTREILKPVVEALVKDEFNRK